MVLSLSIFRAKPDLDKIKQNTIEKRATEKSNGPNNKLKRQSKAKGGSASVTSGSTTKLRVSVPGEIKLKLASDAGSVGTHSSSQPKMKELQYHTMCQLFESWELVRNSIGNDWEYVVGTKVLIRLFDIEPRTKAVFGLHDVGKVTEDDLLENSSTKTHVALLVLMLDSILSMLGPTCETVDELINDLAVRHSRRGVKTLFIPFMGRAIVNCLAEILGECWRPSYADAWETFMDNVGEVFMKILVADQQ